MLPRTRSTPILKRTLQLAGILLVLGVVLGYYLYAASLDPYLHPWDERFHAVVAKRMMDDPLTPRLYPDTVVAADYSEWDRAHIWLHKQPLFMWCMALSMWLFGASELALRLPSVVLAAAWILLLFRCGVLLQGRQTGLWASLLGLSCYFLFDLVSGRQGMEHNDVAFMVWTSASLWALMEWRARPRWRYMVLIGLFAGCAVLTKWLPGMLVFGVWGMSLLMDGGGQALRQAWRPMAAALGVALLVAAPWQLYIHLRFPEAAALELAYNARHFTEALEGHAHPWDFHLQGFGVLYGWSVLPLLGLGLVWGWRDPQRRGLVVALLAGIVAVYGFYSLAATKMPAYPFMVALPVFLLGASGLAGLGERAARGRVGRVLFPVLVVAGLGLMGMRFDWTALRRDHLDQSKEGNIAAFCALHNRAVLKRLDSALPDSTLLFNVNGRQYVEAMFYTRFRAFGFMPDPAQCRALTEQGFHVTLFENPRTPVPEEVKKVPGVTVLEERLKGFL